MKRKKTKSYWVEDTPEKLDYINQTLYEENMKLNKELAKYTRAFEILKERLEINFEKVEFDEGQYPKLTLNMVRIQNKKSHRNMIISLDLFKEEYELLEELLNG